MKMKRSPVLVASLGALLVAGCSKADIDKASAAINSGAPVVADDGLIYAQIESKFVQIDGNSALHVAVSAHEGDVRISGRVKTAQTKTKYDDAAKAVQGVKNVVDTITVDGSLPTAGKSADDFALASAVRLNETGQAGVNGVKLGIAANAGVVTLTGDVASESLHKTILDTATGTAGVKRVEDKLHVSP